jgi:hypothetical protein
MASVVAHTGYATTGPLCKDDLAFHTQEICEFECIGGVAVSPCQVDILCYHTAKTGVGCVLELANQMSR